MTPAEHPVRRPALISAALAPVFFIGGTVVAELGWPSFDPVTQTISALAAEDSPTRVLMTTMFVLTGICHLITAAYTPGIGRLGRITLGSAGFALFAVAAFPLPRVDDTTATTAHYVSAMIGFILLAAWPFLGMRRGPEHPWLLRPLGATLSSMLLGSLCIWFAVTEATEGAQFVGLSERIAANLESLWPLFVVIALVMHRRSRSRGAEARAGAAPVQVQK